MALDVGVLGRSLKLGNYQLIHLLTPLCKRHTWFTPSKGRRRWDRVAVLRRARLHLRGGAAAGRERIRQEQVQPGGELDANLIDIIDVNWLIK